MLQPPDAAHAPPPRRATVAMIPNPDPSGDKPHAEDLALAERLLAGDEAAFLQLVKCYHAPLLRLARSFVADAGTAEEVVQDAWVGVLKGLARFEGRSSLKTWIFKILTNRAKTRGVRDKRMVASPLAGADGEADPVVDPARFNERGAWAAPPQRWPEQSPETLLLEGETRQVIEGAIAELPPNQRAVITLRDLQGADSDDVCNILEISQTNQRVLLHRARSRVRRELERHLDEG